MLANRGVNIGVALHNKLEIDKLIDEKINRISHESNNNN